MIIIEVKYLLGFTFHGSCNKQTKSNFAPKVQKRNKVLVKFYLFSDTFFRLGWPSFVFMKLTCRKLIPIKLLVF